jgi:transcriptional regulator with XRE-family HTH domain
LFAWHRRAPIADSFCQTAEKGLCSTIAFQQAEISLMESSKYHRFGPALSRLRAARGIKQIALAAASGITEARMNKLERGRIVGPGRDAVTRIAQALQLSDIQALSLHESAGHDRCMLEIARNFPESYQLDLISAALDVVRINSQEDCQELAKAMRLLVSGRQGVNAFNRELEEATMT